MLNIYIGKAQIMSRIGILVTTVCTGGIHHLNVTIMLGVWYFVDTSLSHRNNLLFPGFYFSTI